MGARVSERERKEKLTNKKFLLSDSYKFTDVTRVGVCCMECWDSSKLTCLKSCESKMSRASWSKIIKCAGRSMLKLVHGKLTATKNSVSFL